jgi:2,4-dienoyl-CoA reductase-like NADH-dependent reductase (Old Yellow Enzyme family)
MTELFEAIEINGMRLKNRSVRSATWTGMAEPDGRYSKKLMRLTTDLAKGEVGLIITGFAYVLSNGKALAGQAGIHNDAMIPRLKEATKKVHKAGGKICMQIVHAGAQTLIRETKDQPIWGPSPVLNKIFQKTPKAMSQREIGDTVRAFGRAAERVKKAGFDAVEIHGAHGYLVSQFLSPATNKRTDKYGGSLANRARFLFQIYRAVRKAVGKDFPVLIKLNCKDFVRGGLKDTDALSVAKQLDKMGIDAIEVSGGVPAAGDLGPARLKIRKASDEAYFLSIANRIKKQVSVPIVLVGGIRSFKTINDILKSGKADLISMARPFIREPHLIKRWKKGNHKKATCISCNKCFPTGMSREGLHCAVERRLLERKKK